MRKTFQSETDGNKSNNPGGIVKISRFHKVPWEGTEAEQHRNVIGKTFITSKAGVHGVDTSLFASRENISSAEIRPFDYPKQDVVTVAEERVHHPTTAVSPLLLPCNFGAKLPLPRTTCQNGAASSTGNFPLGNGDERYFDASRNLPFARTSTHKRTVKVYDDVNNCYVDMPLIGSDVQERNEFDCRNHDYLNTASRISDKKLHHTDFVNIPSRYRNVHKNRMYQFRDDMNLDSVRIYDEDNQRYVNMPLVLHRLPNMLAINDSVPCNVSRCKVPENYDVYQNSLEGCNVYREAAETGENICTKATDIPISSYDKGCNLLGNVSTAASTCRGKSAKLFDESERKFALNEPEAHSNQSNVNAPLFTLTNRQIRYENIDRILLKSDCKANIKHEDNSAYSVYPNSSLNSKTIISANSVENTDTPNYIRELKKYFPKTHSGENRSSINNHLHNYNNDDDNGCDFAAKGPSSPINTILNQRDLLFKQQQRAECKDRRAEECETLKVHDERNECFIEMPLIQQKVAVVYTPENRFHFRETPANLSPRTVDAYINIGNSYERQKGFEAGRKVVAAERETAKAIFNKQFFSVEKQQHAASRNMTEATVNGFKGSFRPNFIGKSNAEDNLAAGSTEQSRHRYEDQFALKVCKASKRGERIGESIAMATAADEEKRLDLNTSAKSSGGRCVIDTTDHASGKRIAGEAKSYCCIYAENAKRCKKSTPKLESEKSFRELDMDGSLTGESGRSSSDRKIRNRPRVAVASEYNVGGRTNGKDHHLDKHSRISLHPKKLFKSCALAKGITQQSSSTAINNSCASAVSFPAETYSSAGGGGGGESSSDNSASFDEPKMGKFEGCRRVRRDEARRRSSRRDCRNTSIVAVGFVADDCPKISERSCWCLGCSSSSTPQRTSTPCRCSSNDPQQIIIPRRRKNTHNLALKPDNEQNRAKRATNRKKDGAEEDTKNGCPQKRTQSSKRKNDNGKQIKITNMFQSMSPTKRHQKDNEIVGCRSANTRQINSTCTVKQIRRSIRTDASCVGKCESVNNDQGKISVDLPGHNSRIEANKSPHSDSSGDFQVTPATRNRKQPIVDSAASSYTSLNKVDALQSVTTLTDEICKRLVESVGTNVPMEIVFILIYRKGFRQITKPAAGINRQGMKCNPRGLLIGLSSENKSNHVLFYMPLENKRWLNFQNPISLLNACLSCPCRRVCYETQALFVLLMDVFKIPEERVSLEWRVHDLMVGCWLLNPDEPPETPRQALSALLRLGQRVSAPDDGDGDDSIHRSVQVLSKGVQKMTARLKEMKLWWLFCEIETKIVAILAVMEYRGIAVHRDRMEALRETLKVSIKSVENKAHSTAGRAFSLNSTAQLREILYQVLELDVKHKVDIKKTSMLGEKSTSEPMLQQLRKYHALPGCVLEYRHLHKAKSVYVDSMLEHIQEDVIYTTWQQTKTATGRISSCQPNLQSVPKTPLSLQLFSEDGLAETVHLRSPYMSRTGYTFLAADFQQIEFRLFAHLTQDVKLLEVFRMPGDIFTSLGKFWREDGDSRIIREQTKRLVYSIMYGAGPKKISEFLCVSTHEATSIVDSFLRKFPGIREYSRRTISQCRTQGYLCSLSGRRRIFPNINSSVTRLRTQAERQAVNFTIQGSAADVCKAAMIHTENAIRSRRHLRCHLLLQIHDELVWEVADDQVNEVTELIKEVIDDRDVSYCGAFAQITVPLPVTLSAGKCWAFME